MLTIAPDVHAEITWSDCLIHERLIVWEKVSQIVSVSLEDLDSQAPGRSHPHLSSNPDGTADKEELCFGKTIV